MPEKRYLLEVTESELQGLQIAAQFASTWIIKETLERQGSVDYWQRLMAEQPTDPTLPDSLRVAEENLASLLTRKALVERARMVPYRSEPAPARRRKS